MDGKVNRGADADANARDAEALPRYIVGMDAHSRKVSLCVAEHRYGQDPKILRELGDVALESLETTYKNKVPTDSVTVIEASTNSFSIARRLQRIGYDARVVVSDILGGLSRKDRINDRIDASRLAVAYARFGATRDQALVPSPRFMAYRDVFFAYRNAVKDLTRDSNRIWSFCSAHGLPLPKRRRDRKVEDVKAHADKAGLEECSMFHLDDLLAEYKHALERRDRLHRKISETVAREPVMTRLLQIPGVAAVTAFALAAFVEDVRRFATPEKLVAYVGLNPTVSESGEGKSPDKLSRYGQKNLKTLFAEVGQSLLRRSTGCGISRWARAKLAAGKPYAAMVIAAGRKALVYAWHDMMGHPTPDRESEALFRSKLRKIYKEIGAAAPSATGHADPAGYVAAVADPLYAHLPPKAKTPPKPRSRRAKRDDAAGPIGSADRPSPASRGN